MNLHEQKESTCTSPGSVEPGSEKGVESGSEESTGGSTGGGPEEKVAKKGRGGIYKSPPFKGGEVFTRITVVRFSHEAKSQQFWHCLCVCGKEIVTRRASLLTGATQSCGCLKKERLLEANTTHGDAGKDQHSTEYHSWSCMKQRCNNPKNPNYPFYGGRGIKICDRWQSSFENFLADMGRKPSKDYSIDRIDNDGDYEPTNCKWSTSKEQTCNQGKNVKLTFQGRTETISEWARILDVPRVTIDARWRRGWTVEKTFTTPFKKLRIVC